jgi:hypothetical protein
MQAFDGQTLEPLRSLKHVVLPPLDIPLKKGVVRAMVEGRKSPLLSSTVPSAHPGAENIAGVSAKQPGRLVLR